mgnify:CR=1 FL=1
MMKILVTGCNGQVGRFLNKKLSAKKDVELLACNRTSMDITNPDAVIEIIREFEPNFIINAAAHTAVDIAESEIELSFAINSLGAQYLAEAAKLVDAYIIHISTDYVFPGDKDGLYIENDLTGPKSVYGQSKLAGEVAIAQTCNKYIILRTAWVFSEYGGNFVKTMLFRI